MLTPVLIVSTLPVLFMVLTAIGARRRGAGRPLALVTGLLFPAAWIAWFVVDNRHAGRPPFRGR